jgi:peptidoglycan hydrolase-like protein with peptidoglycan-binding domain
VNDLEAKVIVDEVGEEMGLAPIERLAVRLVAKHETQYGAGWDAKHSPPRAELGAGSNNMGAVTTTSTIPDNFFVHGDSRFDPKTGKVVQYETKFSKHATPQAGFRELAQVLLFKPGTHERRENVARALELGSLLELATAMRMNRYFLGVKPMPEAIEDYRSALERRYEQVKAATGEDYFSAPKADPGSPGAWGSEPASPSSQSAPQYLQQLSSSLPVLRQGARGDVVGVMQFELGVEPDEHFGPKTFRRLIEFQQERGIQTDIAPSGKPLPQGVCGVKTWAALFAVEVGAGDDFDDANRVGGELLAANEGDDQVENTIA